MKKTNLLHLILCLCFTLSSIHFSFAQGDPKGYEPPTTISDADAYQYANNFKAANGTSASGGVITREALDLILKTTDCNAVTYKFCMDPSGKIAPAGSVFIVLSGANVTVNNGTTTVTEIGASKYNSNDWCPPNCMKFMILDPATGVIRPVE